MLFVLDGPASVLLAAGFAGALAGDEHAVAGHSGSGYVVHLVSEEAKVHMRSSLEVKTSLEREGVMFHEVNHDIKLQEV